ncbi:MAG: FAD-dependent monooxygenase, partial [Amylibacter sp.]|nr:FAD-dependent monooxygenase [Amylibacter sp.]
MNCDVCIIGAGPVGMLLGNLLGRRGISVAIIEKQPKPYNLPRAVHF